MTDRTKCRFGFTGDKQHVNSRHIILRTFNDVEDCLKDCIRDKVRTKGTIRNHPTAIHGLLNSPLLNSGNMNQVKTKSTQDPIGQDVLKTNNLCRKLEISKPQQLSNNVTRGRFERKRSISDPNIFQVHRSEPPKIYAFSNIEQNETVSKDTADLTKVSVLTTPLLQLEENFYNRQINHKEICFDTFCFSRCQIYFRVLLICSLLSSVFPSAVIVLNNLDILRVNSGNSTLGQPMVIYPSGEWTADAEPGCKSVYIYTIADYEVKIENSANTLPICLFVDATQKDNDWSNFTQHTKTESVKHLFVKGDSSYKTIIGLLSAFHSAKTVKVVGTSQTNRTLKHRRRLSGRTQKIKLAVSTLTFENFRECSDMFEVIDRHFLMVDLKKLVLRKVIVDRQNVNSIRTIIRNTRFSLETMHFLETQWNTSLFLGFLKVLIKVKEIHMDFIGSLKPDTPYLGNWTSFIIPNLEVLTSNRGSIPYNQLLSLLLSPKISKIKTNVMIGVEEGPFCYQEFRKAQSLRNVVLDIEFENPHNCKSLGTKEELINQMHVEVTTNCIQNN